MHGPDSPDAADQAVIDQLVTDTRRRSLAHHVLKAGIFSEAPSHQDFNEFIGALPERPREVLSLMLQEGRDGAIRDVLADRSWWIDCREVGSTVRGEPMPVDRSGMGPHGYYVRRRDGWEWPIESGEDSRASESTRAERPNHRSKVV
jgi:hypothetical protein